MRMPDEFQFDVFLGHSAKDKALVRDLSMRLKNDGIRVWLDEEQINPCHNIPHKTEEVLERSCALVLYVPGNAFGSAPPQFQAGTLWFRDPLTKERGFIFLPLAYNSLNGHNCANASKQERCTRSQTEGLVLVCSYVHCRKCRLHTTQLNTQTKHLRRVQHNG